MKKNVIFFVIVFIIIGVSVNAQIIDLFSFELKPEVSIPTFGSEELFNMGGGASLAMRLSILPFLAPFAEVRYTIHPTILEKSLTLLSTGLGIGLELFPFSIPRLGFGADLSAGYYMATWEDLSAGDFFFRGAVDVTYRFSSTLSLSLGGSYNHYLSVNDPLYQGIGVFLSGSINLGGLRGGTKIKTDSIELQPIFPIFHAFYDKNTVGTFNLTNQEAGDIQDVRVSFFVKQYMDQPKLSALYPSLGRGKSVEVPLYALFTEDVLRLTESTKVSAEIIIEYSFLGSPHQERISNTLHLHHRNAMIWDDDRKAASFVSAKDPAVLRFSKYTAGLIRQEGNSSINQNLRFAMGLFEGLRLYGLNYVIDPTTPYKELSANKAALDYLQFPYQTLVYKGGDCDDLSIMYAAVLESVGIKTAFITIPGHIYMAFDLDMEEEEALDAGGDNTSERRIHESLAGWIKAVAGQREERHGCFPGIRPGLGFVRAGRYSRGGHPDNTAGNRQPAGRIQRQPEPFHQPGDYPQGGNTQEGDLRQRKQPAAGEQAGCSVCEIWHVR